MKRTVRLDEIVRDAALSPRTDLPDGLDTDRVSEFAALLRDEPDALPPPVVVESENGGLLLADGRHRLAAREAIGGEWVERVEVEIRRAGQMPSDETAAFVVGVESAAKVAKGLTLAERQAAVRRLIVELPDASDREIARIVGCSHKTVSAARGTGAASDDDNEETAKEGKPEKTPEDRGVDLVKSLYAYLGARGFTGAYEFKGKFLASVIAENYENPRDVILDFGRVAQGLLSMLKDLADGTDADDGGGDP